MRWEHISDFADEASSDPWPFEDASATSSDGVFAAAPDPVGAPVMSAPRPAATARRDEFVPAPPAPGLAATIDWSPPDSDPKTGQVGTLGVLDTNTHKRMPMAPSKKGIVVAVGVGLLLIGAVFAFAVGREVSNLAVINDLEARDCVADHFQSAEEAAEGDFFTVLFVSRVDCAQPHAYEVYSATSSLWGASEPNPGIDAVFNTGDAFCFDQFERFIGDGLSTPYDYFTFVPTEDSWAEGDRTVRCLVGHSDRTTLLTGSLVDNGAVTNS